ncbi:hypothetical protein CP970_18950 [Streptomyces kanamyceticus]|uniref:Lipoprotein CseA n=1 Tax=Streptomyces kanamyceticus TaxID=1967 RepID=A0A5J6GHU8_STRKN|nr:hypothetical protein CP970_18950 [Streptomyces kanamyceticus]
MRGLGPEARRSVKAASTVVTVLAALGLSLAACSTGGAGARDEGPARSEPVVSASPSPAPSASVPTRKIDAVRLVKDDPKVSTAIKRDLKPCAGDSYPIDVTYGNVTGGTASDVVVNVQTCADAVGIGSYVYRAEGDKYENVFSAEEPASVYAEIDRGDLVVTKQMYEKGDSVAYPSGEEVITYHWSSNHFVETERTRSDFNNAVGGESAAPSDAG